MRTKTNIFPTNLRQECGAEAPQVSNDVYNQRYTSEKVASRYKQSGRSMIEMLGVLAIIGVLTVGSIAGYSHAMRRHLLNKQREQYSYILNAVETHHDMININTPNLPARFTSVLKTFGWIPEEMIRENDNIYIYDVFKNKVFMYYHLKLRYMYIQIDIEDTNAFEQCLNLYQTIIPFHDFLWFTEVNEGNGFTNYLQGTKLKDLTPAKMSQLCQVCKDKNSCSFLVFWK